MDSSPRNELSQQQQQQASTLSGGPQIRSRITVVCAECKRLKLKCDRRSPCASCLKRDTVQRCIYSPAAAEKVDLHSLNNRLIQVESVIAQFSSPTGLSRPFTSSSSSQHPSGLPVPYNDRALLAVGHSGSSLTISLEDVTAIWLDEIDIPKDRDLFPSMTSTYTQVLSAPSPSYSKPESNVKVEPLPGALPSTEKVPLMSLLPPPSLYTSSLFSSAPRVTPSLVAYLPSSAAKRKKLYAGVEEVLKMQPSFNWRHFRERAEGMFKWSSEESAPSTASSQGVSESRSNTSTASKVETARSIFFDISPEPAHTPTPSSKLPTLSFFAAVSAACALGILVSRGDPEDIVDMDDSSDRCSSAKRGRSRTDSSAGKTRVRNSASIKTDVSRSPLALHALSRQALDIFETNNAYDLDYLVALILQVLFMLHDGKPRIPHILFPLIGKMVNVARMMGLAMDPDEFPGKYSLFESEMRRRIWWDVFYYDLFVSDCMGHPPLIPDNSFTTRLPSDVDEDIFSPASATIPAPRASEHPDQTGFRYFELKCRLAQLVKSMKKRTFRDPLRDTDLIPCESFSIEQAATFEAEVTQWISDLPIAYRLDMDIDHTVLNCTSTEQAFLMAQRCELAITANRLILKLYLPFLRSQHGDTNNTGLHQAAGGTVNAAHGIIYASRILNAVWKQAPATLGSGKVRPAMFEFYSFGRAMFDAAVVCAHAVIHQPTTMWARSALDDVSIALDVMREVGEDNEDAIRVVEIMKNKAEGARNVQPGTGSKRKRDELEGDQLGSGFQLPYVGAAVATSTSPVPRLASSPVRNMNPHDSRRSSASDPSRPQHTISSVGADYIRAGSTDTTTTKGSHTSSTSKSSKKGQYPSVGIRVRPGTDGPLSVKQRAEQDKRMAAPPPPAPHTPAHNAPTHPPTPAPENTRFRQPSTPSSQDEYAFSQPPQNSSLSHRNRADSVSSNSNVDPSLPFGGADDSMTLTLMRGKRFSIHETHQHTYESPAPPHNVYDYSGPPPSSSGPIADASSPFASADSSVPTPPFAQHTTSSSPPNFGPLSNFYMPNAYEQSYDSNALAPSEMPPMGLGMSNQQGPPPNSGGSRSGDLMFSLAPPAKPPHPMYRMKHQDVGTLQPPFGNETDVAQPWQNTGPTSNGEQYWNPGYTKFFPQ